MTTRLGKDIKYKEKM
jgi:hypothetical protein